MSWADFESTFFSKYFGMATRAVRWQEFNTLVHGSMSVREYEVRFVELSRFAPDLIPTEELRT